MAMPGEFQGIVSLVVGLTAKCCCGPSRDGALGVIGLSGMANPKNKDLYIFTADIF